MEAILETFRPVVGFEGLYEVSDYGCVRSLKNGKVRYLKNAKDRDGYNHIGLFTDKKQKNYFVHRLVYETFVGPIPEDMEIDHINGVKDDNRINNLRVVTPKQNSHNPVTRERYLEAMKKLHEDPGFQRNHREAMKKLHEDPEYKKKRRDGIRKSCNKPVLQIDKNTGEIIRRWECAADAARELGIYYGNVSQCCRNVKKSAGGYKWRFAS